MIISLLKAFVIGGVLCLAAQLILDKTSLTPARILVIYVISGVALYAIGLYKPFSEWAGSGATVPLSGFGSTLAEGVRKAVDENGLAGIFTGALTSSSGGIAGAIVFSYLASLVFKTKSK